MSGTPRRSTTALVLAAALVVILFIVTGCIRPNPTKTVTFGAASNTGAAILVVIDIIGTPGSGSVFTSYPKEIVSPAPVVHVVIADVGSIAHMSVKAFSTEPGQSVGCNILINMVMVDHTPVTTRRNATCIGPPV